MQNARIYPGIGLLLMFILGLHPSLTQAQKAPTITGAPLYFNPQMLHWPLDRDMEQPDLTTPLSNTVYDLHMEVADCEGFDFILSTAGNFHPALTEYWFDRFLRKHKNVENYYFTTSPPIAHDQHAYAYVSMGNVHLRCKPHVAVGPQQFMEALDIKKLIEGEPVPLFRTQGNVLLVRKGNPKNIRTVHDLGRSDVRLVTPHPTREIGAFQLYANTIYGVAYHAFGQDKADTLFHHIFNRNDSTWIAGQRIHHRELPEIMARDEADVGVLFYQLARYVCQLFPDQFDIVPLGGGVNAPDPLQGNAPITLYAVRLNGQLNERQIAAREAFFKEIGSGKMDKYLKRHYLLPEERK